MLSDTSPEARRVYYRTLAAMTPSQRMAIGVELTVAADEMLRAAIRRRCPDAEGEEFTFQLLRARYGRAVAEQVCRRRPD